MSWYSEAASESEVTTSTTTLSRITSSTYFRVLRYFFVRVVMILITIIIGVFIAVIIANKSGQIDLKVERRIDSQARRHSYRYGNINTDEQRQAYEDEVRRLEQSVGLRLPFLPRHLRWTYNALTLDWGEVMFLNFSGVYYDVEAVNVIVLRHLPNTLLLVGSAYLIIFLFGIPIALTLSRKYGQWQDRLFSFFAPLSSTPSWVIGVLLILIFAVELCLLPFGGMFDFMPPESKVGYIPIVLKHMILPVSAIVISLLFQLIYTWRTFFLIYAHEDYVELARATGLSDRSVERRHILRPTIPYIVTSFALTLVSFWQTTVALEIVFDWPGIGKLYIDSLPHFWGEGMFPGEMVITIAIVVLFAYMLGATVLVLDVVYAVVDPRVRIGYQNSTLMRVRKKISRRSLLKRRKTKQSDEPIRQKYKQLTPIEFEKVETGPSHWLSQVRRWGDRLKSFLKEFSGYPSAIFGLIMIIIMVFGSIYAVIALPYDEVGRLWSTKQLTGRIYVPRYAWPEWVNGFRKGELLSSIVINSQDDAVEKRIQSVSDERLDVTMTFTFDYAYEGFPEEVVLYFSSDYEVKKPFVFLTWIRPDGTEIEMKGFSIGHDQKFNLNEYLSRDNIFSQSNIEEISPADRAVLGNPELFVLFTDQPDEAVVPDPGTYTLRIEGLLFEDLADVDAELVILGQVYGPAGTDFRRRDLLVPLLWGMPFALMVGLLGAVLTSVISMVIAAVGVWFGGWVDALIQRLTEANMILPILALCVLFYAYYHVDLFMIIGIIIVLNVFSSPTKAFRAAFLQVKESPYIEAAQAYGVGNWRIIRLYMIPRIVPVLIPQLVMMIPAYVFLEATLGLFNIKSDYPTWGKVIYDALKHGVTWGSRYWVLEPIALLLLSGFAFTMVGFALDRILNPRLRGL